MRGGAAAGGTDMGRAVVTALAYGLSLSATAVLFPLLALDVGMSAPMVGVFTTVSAVAQLLTRFLLPWLLSRFPDRSLMVTAFVVTGISAAVVLVSTSAAAFVIAQALQGGGRAFFWTSSQTHAARAGGRPVRRLAQVQLAGNSGTLAGPILAGSIAAWSLQLALWVAVTASIAGAVAASLLIKRPPYQRGNRASRRGVWRQPGVTFGCWTSFSAGGWRGMLESFVPVVLTNAGLGAAAVGWLVAASEATSMAVTAWLARSGPTRLAPLAQLCGLAMLVGAAALPFVAHLPAAAAVAMAVAGAGGGLASALGPAIVNGAVPPGEQGAAIALAGTYRAGSRLAAPSALAAAGSVVGVPVAMVAAAIAMVAPVLGLGRRADV